MKTVWTLLLAVALLQEFFPSTVAQQALTFRVGASIGQDGSCALLYNETVLGYQYFFNWMAKQPPIVVTDATGKAYQLRMQLRLVSHNCTEEGRAAAMTSLINGTSADPRTGDPAEPPVHLLLGGHGDNALEDALQADAASRLLLHCCTARDTVFRRGLPHVFGLFTPASLYTSVVLRTMALRGMRRVAVVYTRESLLHVQLCEGALAQLPLLGELRPGFSTVLTVNYSATEAKSPGFWAVTGARVASAGADVLIACDGINRTSLLVDELRRQRHRLSALWLASWGNVAELLDYLDGHGEYVLTSAQWMPNLPYADPDFGTASQYADAFAAATGVKPSYFSAAATASAYVLMTALRQALSMCSLGGLDKGGGGDVADTFMWSQGAELSCGVDVPSRYALGLMTGSSGTAVLRDIISSLNMDTFFGPIGFNAYRQNIFHPVIVAQVLHGELVTVLPLDVADKALVMPIPVEEGATEPWRETAAGISVITLVCCLGLVCLALGVLTCKNRTAPPFMTIGAVEINLDDIQVDIPPQANPDGSFESGEGVYRGTRVKLVVANELLPLLHQQQQQQQQQLPGSASVMGGGGGSSRKGTRGRCAANNQHLPGTSLKDESTSRPQLVLELADATPATSGNCNGSSGATAGVASTANGSLKQSVSLMLSSSSYTVAGPTPPLAISGGGGGAAAARWPITASPYSALGKRSRRRILALVWRAVRLQHPRMCPVLGIVWDWPGLVEGGGRVPMVVRQWYEFASLDRLLENETVPLPLRTKAAIAQGVAEGLAYLHAQEPPIFAGPLDASCVKIDKDFNPHLILRLLNLDPEYGTTAAGASAAADRSHSLRTRCLSRHCGRSILSVPVSRLLCLSKQQWPSPSALPPPPPPPQAVTPPQPSPVQPSLSRSNREPATPRALFARLANTAATEQTVLTAAPQPLRLHQVMATGSAASGGDGGGGDASGASSGNFVSRTSIEISTAFGRVNCSGSGGGGGAAAAAGRSGGGGGGGAPSPSPLPPPSYQASMEQDVHEFGLLLCSIFMISTTADSGWLRFVLRFSHVAGADGDTGVDIGGGGGSGNCVTLSPWLPPASQVNTAVPQIDEHFIDFALSYLRGICPQLADLAQSCLEREPGLNSTAIVEALETKVIPALTDTAGGEGGGDGRGSGVRGGGAGSSGTGMVRQGSSRRVLMAGGGGGHMTQAKREYLGASFSTSRRPVEFAAAAAPSGVAATGAGGQGAPLPARISGGDLSRADRQALKGGPSHRAILTPDDLIFDLFPPKVARALQAGEKVQPERYECVSIFFSDVVGYTDLCGQLQPGEVMDLVHRLYSRFDDLIRELRLFKVETVGDAYLAVGNLRWPQPDDHARLMAQFAFAAVAAANSLPVHPDRPELGTVHVRVGLHCGPVVGSVVGTLNRRYCLFGDAVNTAARMEHNSEADRINCSAAFVALLREQWPAADAATGENGGGGGGGRHAVSRGVLQVKGKGPMELFWLLEGPPGASARSASNQGVQGNGQRTGSLERADWGGKRLSRQGQPEGQCL